MAARRDGRVLVRALDVESGTEKLIDPVADRSALGQAAAAAVEEDKSRRVTVEGRTWLLTVYNTPWELVLVGAVHIAQALAALAGPAGYRVRVIDPRAPYATLERFPNIVLQREWPDEALAHQPLTDRSALIALAHDPKLDDAALAVALRSPAFYIGALGSVRTQARRLARLEAQGFSAADLSRNPRARGTRHRREVSRRDCHCRPGGIGPTPPGTPDGTAHCRRNPGRGHVHAHG